MAVVSAVVLRLRDAFRRPLIGLGAVAAVVAGGCSSSPSVKEWAQRADAICKSNDDAINKLADPGNSLPAMSAYVISVRAIVEKERRALSALESPEGSKGPADLRDYFDAQLDLLDQIRAAANDGQAERVKTLFTQSASELSVTGAHLSRTYGFTSCGTEPANGTS